MSKFTAGKGRVVTENFLRYAMKYCTKFAYKWVMTVEAVSPVNVYYGFFFLKNSPLPPNSLCHVR